MIFQKQSPKFSPPAEPALLDDESPSAARDDVETVVGPSVNVEGDFASEGNIVVKGTVAGSVRTSKHLSVELGARIMANVRSGSATIAGEVRGNMKVKDTLELTATARVMGDIEVKTLMIAAGALVSGKVNMPGLDNGDAKSRGAKLSPVKKIDEMPSA